MIEINEIKDGYHRRQYDDAIGHMFGALADGLENLKAEVDCRMSERIMLLLDLERRNETIRQQNQQLIKLRGQIETLRDVVYGVVRVARVDDL